MSRPAVSPVVAVALVIGVVAGSLLPAVSGPETPPAVAADARQFDPGNLISDALFFNGSAMNAAEVQTFLAGQVKACRPGYTCLKDYRQTTTSKPAVSGRCAAYAGAAGELASAIVAKVGAACGISQTALLVLLEKEQSLVTDDWPSAGQYRSATGFGCPDTAACATQYYGFFNQVYNAALQFKRYAASPTGWSHVAGRVSAIRYSPTASCGAANVLIQNQATAGLYNYTPYQPNKAALANLYGTGDGCSSYGNRNFWRLYTDWFGSSTVSSSLLRTTTDPRVYLVSGQAKYPVVTQQILDVYAPLGPVAYVAKSYLDSFTTMQQAGRILRAPGGAIYFADARKKSPIATCQLVVDYGGQCATTGYVQLTDRQIAAFSNGPALGPVLGTTTGARYLITKGTRREILDARAQADAGLPAAFPVLGETAAAAFPSGRPIVRDAVFVAERGTSAYWYLGNGQRYRVDAGAVVAAQVSRRVAGSLSTASLATIPLGASSFTGMTTTAGSTDVSVLSAGGRYVWRSAGGALKTVAVPAAFRDTYPVRGQVTAGATVKTASSPVVSLVLADRVRPVSTWDALVALVPKPTITTVPDALLAALPKGPAITLPTTTLVRSANSQTTYLVNGVTGKVPLAGPTQPAQAGVTRTIVVPQASLDAYPTSSTRLGFGVVCGTTAYVSAGGALHPLTAAQRALYPFSYVTLDAYACRPLKVGSPATAFIRTPDGKIYQLVAGQKRYIASPQRFAQLSKGQPYLDVHPLFAAAIPSGPNA